MFAWGQIYFQERWTLGVTRDMCRKRETKWQTTKKNINWRLMVVHIKRRTWGRIQDVPRHMRMERSLKCRLWYLKSVLSGDFGSTTWNFSCFLRSLHWKCLHFMNFSKSLAVLTNSIRFMKSFISQNRNLFKASLSCDIKWTSYIPTISDLKKSYNLNPQIKP